MTGTRCCYRRGFNLDVLLRPHAEHILLAPTLIYKGIQATIGMEKLLPYAVVSTASFLASVVLLFLYLRRRVGEWLALAGVLPGAVHGHGLGGAALALRGLLHRLDGRRDRRAAGAGARGRPRRCAGLRSPRRLAGLLRARPLASPWARRSSMILARRPWSRAYVVVVPIVLYALGTPAGVTRPRATSRLRNLVHSPIYVLKGLAASAASLLGVPDLRASVAVGLALRGRCSP